MLEVADEGPGLFPRRRRRCSSASTGPIRPGTGNLGGTGLGLSIVAAVAEAHGGQARVESVPGQGARFWVELPLARHHAGGGRGRPPPRRPPPGRRPPDGGRAAANGRDPGDISPGSQAIPSMLTARGC